MSGGENKAGIQTELGHSAKAKTAIDATPAVLDALWSDAGLPY